MSYTEFINSLGSGFTLFYDNLISLSNALINNYFIVTMLGLSIFTFLIYLFFDNILTIPFINKKRKTNLDNVKGGK